MKKVHLLLIFEEKITKSIASCTNYDQLWCCWKMIWSLTDTFFKTTGTSQAPIAATSRLLSLYEEKSAQLFIK